MTRNQAGYILLEVLVALVVLTACFAALMQALVGSLRASRGLAAEIRALDVARAQLAGYGIATPIDNEAREGVTADGYRWVLEPRILTTTDDYGAFVLRAYHVTAKVKGPASAAQDAPSIELHAVKVAREHRR